MRRSTFFLTVRIATWISNLAIILLSLLPTDAITRTGFGGHIEHVVAYFGASFLTGLAYGTGRGVIIGLLALAGALECLQTFSPGRTSSVVDYFFSAIGIGLGSLSAGLLKDSVDMWVRQRPPSDPQS